MLKPVIGERLLSVDDNFVPEGVASVSFQAAGDWQKVKGEMKEIYRTVFTSDVHLTAVVVIARFPESMQAVFATRLEQSVAKKVSWEKEDSLDFTKLWTVTSKEDLRWDWPPADPHEYETKTDFTLKWATRLKGFHTLEDLQRAAKAKGTISERSLEGDDPVVSFHWRSEPAVGPETGYMLATVRPNGLIAVSIFTTDLHQVIVNNVGFFSAEEMFKK